MGKKRLNFSAFPFTGSHPTKLLIFCIVTEGMVIAEL